MDENGFPVDTRPSAEDQAVFNIVDCSLQRKDVRFLGSIFSPGNRYRIMVLAEGLPVELGVTERPYPRMIDLRGKQKKERP
jgi:hypothetical protein